MKPFILPLLMVLLMLSGCAELAIKDTDSTGDKIGKGIFRTVLGLATVGISEISIAEEVARERCESSGRVMLFSTCMDRAGARRAAELLLPLAYQNYQNALSRQLTPPPQVPIFQPSVPPAPSVFPTRPPSIYCQSTRLGNTVQTICP